MDSKWLVLHPEQLEDLLAEEYHRGLIQGRVPAFPAFLIGGLAGFLLGMLAFYH